MTSTGRVLLGDIFAMLDECAPGWTKRDAIHHVRITYRNKIYPSLPKGEHGKRPGRGEVKRKEARDLAEFFGILDCARKHLEILR